MPSSFNSYQHEFERFDLSLSQHAMQAFLDCEYAREGLPRVLDLLWEWESRVGYFSLEKLWQNPRYEYYDAETAVTLRAQINLARNNYMPKPASAAADLHCAICYENLHLPEKERLRVFKFVLNEGREYFVQVTPFPLFEKHFVLITMDRLPMQMNRQSVADLLRFVELARSYVGCSNSDVEWAGASILAHHHYQVFERLDLPIMHARFVRECFVEREEIAFGLLDFSMACCKVTSAARESLLDVCGNIIAAWKRLEPGKNTCNLVLLKNATRFDCYILFRNPAFRTAKDLLAIKSEGVGVVEVAGEGIYPVPQGENAAELWRQIEHEGLAVIKRIIATNNPIPREKFGELFDFLKSVVPR